MSVRVSVTCLISNVVPNPCSRPKPTETPRKYDIIIDKPMNNRDQLSWFAPLTHLSVLDSSHFGMDCHSNYRMCITFCSLIGKSGSLTLAILGYVIRLQ